MIRLIATDLDGTLLTPDGILPEGVFEVIEALGAQGVHFAAASGRQLGNLRRLFAPVADDIHYICENGAVNAIHGEVFNVNPIPNEMGRKIIADLQSKRLHLLVSGRHTCYLDARDRAFNDMIIYELRNTITVVDDLSQLTEDFMKLSGYRETGVEDVAPVLTRAWGDKLKTAIAGFGWFDLTVANKGVGIRALAQKLDIPLSDVAAFGDQPNDESMLDIVGHPYIMQSGAAEMQKPGYAPCQNVLQTLQSFLRA